jgi:hypothetical protein
MRNAWFVVALLGVGCHHAKSATPPEPEVRTVLSVRNQNFQDMDVFLLAAGQRIRLGMVNGNTTSDFTLPDHIVRVSQQLQFELHPIGGRSNPISESITVIRGDHVQLTVPPF